MDAAYSAKGSQVAIQIRDSRHPARIVALPFVKNV
jgi:glycine cleavage system aminomethyltransferase T